MPTIESVVGDGIAIVRIDNPSKRNALTLQMWQAIPPVFAELSQDPAVTAIVLTGVGRHFCAGSDIASLHALDDGALPVAAELAISNCPKPVIGAISGSCFGGGCELAAACDLRIAGEDARFCVPPANLGVVYPLPGTQRLVSLIGPAATKYLMFTGDAITASRALHIGLVDEVVSDDVVEDRARHLAARIATRSQLSVHATKQLVDTLSRGEDATQLARDWIARAAAGPDLVEGKAAFLERRPANFSWRPDSGSASGYA